MSRQSPSCRGNQDARNKSSMLIMLTDIDCMICPEATITIVRASTYPFPIGLAVFTVASDWMVCSRQEKKGCFPCGTWKAFQQESVLLSIRLTTYVPQQASTWLHCRASGTGSQEIACVDFGDGCHLQMESTGATCA